MHADELNGLRRFAPDEHLVVSVFVTIPADPAAARGSAGRIRTLLQPLRGKLEELPHEAAESLRCDLDALAEDADRIAGHAGCTVAIFRCHARGLRQEHLLRHEVPDLAVAEPMPSLRAFDAAIGDRSRDAVVLVHKRLARIFELQDGAIDPLAEIEDEGQRTESFGGWHGLEEYRVRQHALEVTHKHYKRIVERLEQLHAERRFDGILLGGQSGHGDELRAFLPHALEELVLGTFVVDPASATTSTIAEACEPLVAERAHAKDQALLQAVSDRLHTAEAVIGIRDVAEAANLAAIDTLLVERSATVPGGVCDACSVIVLEGERCTTCDGALRHTSDVLGAIVEHTLRTGGTVRHLHDPDAAPVQPVSALLRFPLPQAATAGPA